MSAVPDAAAVLVEFAPEHEFFVGVDSDGCAFDAMDIKHLECFTPNTIKHWDLQPISTLARETAIFVNLGSTTRGLNRWIALKQVLDLLQDRAEVAERGFEVPAGVELQRFLDSEYPLSDVGIAAFAQANPSEEIDRAIRWGKAVNESIAAMVRNCGPFGGVPITGIAEATFARALSSSLPQRQAARGVLAGHTQPWAIDDPTAFIEDIRQALYSSKVVAYSQGFDQIAAASVEYEWDIDRAAVARIWRGGCIIRARFLNRIAEAYERDSDLPLLLSDSYFAQVLDEGLPSLRRVVSQAALSGVPTPAFASSLSYYDGLRAERTSAAVIQGQRDLFGAHTYRRVDKEGSFHTLWASDRREVPA